MISLDYIPLIGSALILVSITIAKLSDNLGVPTLLLFLAVGMLAGSEGPGGIFSKTILSLDQLLSSHWYLSSLLAVLTPSGR